MDKARGHVPEIDRYAFYDLSIKTKFDWEEHAISAALRATI